MHDPAILERINTEREIVWKSPRDHSKNRHGSILLLTSVCEGGLVVFRGCSIPGIVRVVDANKKMGNYTLRIAAGVAEIQWGSSYETGLLFDSNSWQKIYDTFLQALRWRTDNQDVMGPGMIKFEAFIRKEFPGDAQQLDRNESLALAKTPEDLVKAFAAASGDG